MIIEHSVDVGRHWGDMRGYQSHVTKLFLIVHFWTDICQALQIMGLGLVSPKISGDLFVSSFLSHLQFWNSRVCIYSVLPGELFYTWKINNCN